MENDNLVEIIQLWKLVGDEIKTEDDLLLTMANGKITYIKDGFGIEKKYIDISPIN